MSSPTAHLRDSIPTLLRWRILRRHVIATTALLTCVLPFLVTGLTETTSSNRPQVRAAVSDAVSVRVSGQTNPTINLSDGHDLVTSYSGPENLRVAFEHNQAEPLSLTSADFNEDGTPDLVSGYSYQGRGVVSVLKGNVDSVYPNSPGAQRRKTEGTFTDAPFLSPAALFALPIPADFIGAGDFDADGHLDLVAASRTHAQLVLLAGDGHGAFIARPVIELPGIVTAMTTGEINRPDGLTDIAVAIDGRTGSQVLIYEGPDGALRSHPEAFALDARPVGLVLAKLNHDYLGDLGVAAGAELIVIEGRDRKLSLDGAGRARAAKANVIRQQLPFIATSISAGNFTGDHSEELALLAEDRTLHVLSRSTPGVSADGWSVEPGISGSWSGSARLMTARVSTSNADDLLLNDPSNNSLQILIAEPRTTGKPVASEMKTSRGQVVASLDVAGGSRAVLPMRLNFDSRSDLVILRTNQSAPSFVTSPQQPEATFVVTNTNDSGAGSLRDAINQANLAAGADLITFAIATGPLTIIPTSPLPTITDGNLTIDGTTQPGFAGTPIIEINGSSVANGTFGLLITGGNTTVRGLAINRFGGSGNAIRLQTNGGNIIEGNYLGTNIAGTAALPNGTGVFFNSSSNNTIGGTTFAGRNVISGNDRAGIDTFAISGFTTSGNLIQGNFIGTNHAGNADLGNATNGISLFRVASSTVGGTTPGAGNLISGNGNSGIGVQTTNGNLVQGNLIGTDRTGAFDLGNAQSGVSTTSGSADTFGGTTPAARNIISGNNGQGILIRGDLNLIQGNYIGTNAQGTAAIGNTLNGIATSDAPNNTIGGATAAARNIISANGLNGVSIGLDLLSGSTGITVRNNYIGTDASGINCLGNFREGVVVNRGAVSHTIADNLITCNGLNGVNIPNAGAADPAIRIEVFDNQIFANGQLGIDLGETGITPNDLGDPDGGANFQQNFPVLNSFGPAALADGKPFDATLDAITVNATLNSTPNTTFTVHWYFSGDTQCRSNQVTGRPLVTGKVPGVKTDGSGNASFNFPFDFPSAINRGIINCTATDPQGNTSEFSACLVVTAETPTTSTVQFASSTANVNETLNATTKVDLNVIRSGDTSGPATVDYSSSDGTANDRSDYLAALGTVRFAAGETSKTVSVFIVDDRLGESNESFNITLSNPVGMVLGSPSTVRVTINTNEIVNGPNPVKDATFNTDFFVRQHYVDFLNREADPGGLAHWKNEIDACPNAPCREVKRVNVSAAFFVSIEFQETGYLVYKAYQAAYDSGEFLRLRDFLPDLQDIGRGVVIGDPGWPALLEANKERFFNNFVQRPKFVEPGNYPTTMTAAEFVDKLNANTIDPRNPGAAALTESQRGTLIAELTPNPSSPTLRAQVVRSVSENSLFSSRQFNKAFVLMQYFGYMRRNPNDPPEAALDFSGYNFWLTKLNDFNGNYIEAEMVRAFITSFEYEQRFGP